MRHGLAALVALSIVSLQGQSLAFHVHAFAGHDHAAHRHAPAIHHHRDRDDANQTPHFTDVDPSASTVTLIVPAAVALSASHLLAEVRSVLQLPELQASDRTRVADTRSHGPPARRAVLLRGPPATLPA